MIQIIYAFLAGILTIAAPCILPMLPILLGASVGQNSRQRPLLIVAGFVVSFAAFSLLLSALVSNLGLSPNLLRNLAIIFLVLFAVFMIWPKPFELLTLKLSTLINRANQLGRGNGHWSGLILGLVLGIVWTPCAGPVLGTILTLIATQGTTAKAAALISAYAIGAGLPMLIIAYGSQWITTKVRAIARYSTRLQQIFGMLVLALAVVMYFQYDVKLINNFSQLFPQNSLEQKLVETQSSSGANGQQLFPNNIVFQNYGPAPEFTGIDHWLNSDPLTLKDLKGKVVLVDFWTYSCINCIRTLPYVTGWYDKYNKDGFVVIGVHTPEFAFEKETDNVQKAIAQFNIKYPVAQDNNYATWNAYKNQYWPAEYLIDKNGQLVYTHFGEGNYDHTENAIRQLLDMPYDKDAKTGAPSEKIGSPEMYFEPSRLQYFSPAQQPTLAEQNYSLPEKLDLNNFALEGKWKFTEDHAESGGPGKIRLRFSSGKVYMVAASTNPQTIKITIDGKIQPDVEIQASRLYKLYDSNDYKEHIIDIEIPRAGFQAFTFTFG